MILRRPFAFLIKNFKLIHLIFSFILLYILIKIYNITTFLGTYLKSPVTLLTPEFVKETVPIFVVFLLFALIIGYIIVLILMKYKEKPITFYFVSIINCIISVIIYIVIYNNFIRLEINLLDVRTLKLMQDLTNTMLILQSVSTIINVIRATGFNIKKFDFSKDLETVDVAKEDNEEFEVNVEFEEGKYRRYFNKFKRVTKYVIVENKLLISITVLIIILLASGIIYYNNMVLNKIYHIGDSLNISDYNITFTNSLYTNKDAFGNVNDLKSYVLVNVNISDLFDKKENFETALLSLEINEHRFYHDRDAKDKFFDIGVGYNNEIITKDGNNYLLIYEIPTNFVDDEMYLVYYENNKKIRIKVNPIEIKESTENKTANLTQPLDLKNSILNSGILKINSYQVGLTFKNSYNFCIRENDCYLSNEYIYPSFSGNYKKALLKLEVEFNESKNNNIDEFMELMNNFGTIYYNVNNELKKINKFKLVEPSKSKQKNIYYIECPEDIINASSIYIEFKLRGNIYKYNIK